MARGYPDFFGYSIFPGLGTASKSESALVACPAGLTTQIFELLLKGSVIGGWIYGNVAGGVNEHQLLLTIDGVELARIDIWTALYANEIQDEGFLFPITLWNLEDNVEQVRIAEQISFGYQYKLELDNNSIVDVDMAYGVYYYQII